MSRVALRKPGVSVIATVGVSVALAACGSSSNDSATTSKAAPSGGGGPDVAAAKAAVADFIGKPSAFPVTEKLKQRPEGKSVAFMDPGTSTGAVLYQLMQPAAKTLGVKLTRYKAGPAANTTTNGFDSAVAAKPDGVIIGGTDPVKFVSQLKQLRSAKTPVVATAIINGAQFDLEPVNGGQADGTRSGKLMANYVIGHMNPKANVVVYDLPEVPLIGFIGQTFSKELKRVCSSCSVRTVHIPAATVGNTAPSTIVSDLQSHPKTNVAMFASDEVQLGLPDALKKAGIKIETLGFGPGPQNLQQLKEGKETAVLAADLPVSVWTIMDQMARGLAGQKITSGPEAKGYTVVRFLTPKDITFNPKLGWTGYPDFAKRFAKLWGAGAQ